eukprot:Nitzschia sp. Nitz4//scaffold76_size158648//68295//68807//NITZ4_002545-RA/size158648-processed-gene-0.265-mRNA-1//-1//CDS//3329557842//2233//frame0
MNPQLEMRLAFRLVVAAVLGATLGRERSFSRRHAGVRTMALVSLGAAVFTICSAYGFPQITGKYDPSRMAANVVSGVGFVGAGVITTSSQGEPQGAVRGLTTAATVWLSAAIGVACGVGLFGIAFVAMSTTLSILWMGRRKAVNRALRASSYERTQSSNEEDLVHPPEDS